MYCLITQHLIGRAIEFGPILRKSICTRAAFFKEKTIIGIDEISSKITSNASHINEHIVKKIVRFIKDNWATLIKFSIAWGVIIAGIGLLYGFSAVAWPLAIGLSCGIGFGLLTGVITKTIIKPDTDAKTIWEFVNSWINGLDANGHRAIVTSIIVTVVLAATVFFPIAVGSILGFVLGNHISTKIAYGLNFGPRPESKNSLLQRLHAVDNELKQIKRQQLLIDATVQNEPT
jgi:hypothetical protein